MLVRRHVAKLLADYYAQPANSVVGSVLLTEGDINFGALWGEFHYRQVCSRLYAKQEGRWLTSVELMRPAYSRALGNFVASEARADSHDQGFDIVEIGGGRATNASVILTQLQQAHPEVYEKINSFTMIDASPSLLDLQEKTMRAGDHFDKMKFQLNDMIDVAENNTPFLSVSDIPTVTITCELLDNLPHDKVRDRGGKLLEQGEIVQSEDGESLNEVFSPLSDPLLSSVLKLAPEYTQSRQAWVPTVACGILKRLQKERPNSSVLLADFDYLPLPDITKEQEEMERSSSWAPGEPIVTDMEGNDHPCYIQSPAHCDILFPTDFHRLEAFVKKIWNGKGSKKYQVQVQKQSDFLQQHGPEQVEATRSWLTSFTPMLHDFANCSVLTVSQRTGEGVQTPTEHNIKRPGKKIRIKKKRKG